MPRLLLVEDDRALAEALALEAPGHDDVGNSRIVDAAVARLRAKIEDDPPNPVMLRTVRGLGYRLAGK